MEKPVLIYQDSQLIRLDAFLAQSLPAYSRTFWQTLIENGGVLVNLKPITTVSWKLKAGDQVCYDLSCLSAPTQAKTIPTQPLEILLENHDFLAINKPAGLLVHSTGPESDEVSLFDLLKQRINQDAAALERAGLVHRLDKETSGVILVAKNPSSQFRLSALFSSRAITKTYLAIVVGHPQASGVIDKPLGRHPQQRHKRAIDGIGAKPAITSFEVIKYFDTYSLLKVQIATGRTHQIRVHLASIGHSVLGDFLYGQPTKLIARQALHASSLKFEFNHCHYEIVAPLPEDLQRLIDNEK